MKSNEEEKIALIDADSLLYYCALGNKEHPPKLEEAQKDMDNRIYNMVQLGGCKQYVLFTTNRRTTFRNKVAVTKEYKGNRKRKPLPPVFYGLQAYLKQKPTFEYKGLEADDSVALFKTLFAEYYGKSAVIFSPDKDVLGQVVGIHYNYGKETLVETSEDSAYGFLMKQLIMGDSADGIPGIPGMGEKRTEKVLDKISDINDILATVLDLYNKHFGFPEGLTKFNETFRLVYLLRNNKDLINEGLDPITKEQFDYALYGDEDRPGVLLNLSKAIW